MTDHMQTVLDFWFGAKGSPEYGENRKIWWVQDDAFDASVAEALGDLSSQAKTGAFDGWVMSAEGTLALVILLDQVPRNLFRDSPQAFAFDGIALSHSHNLVANTRHLDLPGVFRQCVLLPFQHAEDLAVQEQSVALYEELGLADGRASAKQHRDIIKRFGRFPHRNAVLGRPSTADEIAFLENPDRPSFAGGKK